MINLCYRVELNVIGTVITEPYVPELVPKEDITGFKASLMQFERAEANASEADFVIIAEPEIKAFFTAYPDHEKITVAVWEYDFWEPSNERCVFSGRFDAPPVVVIAADATTYYCRAVGWLATYNEVDLKDGTTRPYRDVYVKWLITCALAAADHRGGARIEIAEMDAAEDYCARIFYPGAHKFGGVYNTTDKIKALCWTGSLLYVGVGEWLCSFDPETRVKTRVARLRYEGREHDLWNSEWRFRVLEYDAGTVYGWAETKGENLRERRAHAKIKFTWVGGAVISLTDANLIHNYDRGVYVKSTCLYYTNHGGPDGKKFYGEAKIAGYDLISHSGPLQAVGDATPPPNKDLGIYLLEGGFSGAVHNLGFNINKFLVDWVKGKPINRGDILYLRESWGPRACQYMGEVKKAEVVRKGPDAYWEVTTEYRTEFPFAGTTAAYWWRPTGNVPRPNLMLPGYRELKVEYDDAPIIGGKLYTRGGRAAPAPVDVTIERRVRVGGRKTFYLPEVLGEANEDAPLAVTGPLVALGSGNEAKQYHVDGDKTYWAAGLPPTFNVLIEDPCQFSTLPVDGYWVENDRQREDRTEKPGHNRLVHNGVVCTEGSVPLETPGNIFLAKEGNKIYVAWNRWRRTNTKNWFLQLVWGRVNGSVITTLGHDRDRDDYQSKPPREITGFAAYKGRLRLGTKRVEPRWVKSDIQIIWAAPPQDMYGDKPINYDGGLVAVCMVPYDKTKYLKEGTLIKVSNSIGTEPEEKEYLLSEVDTLTFWIRDAIHSASSYPPEKLTRIKVLFLDPYWPWSHSQKCQWELQDRFIYFQSGFDIKGEICYTEGADLKVSRTARATYNEAYEGARYDWEKLEWKGEEVTPEEEGRYATTELGEKRVVAGTVEVMLKEGHVPFQVVDKTDELTWAVPGLGYCFIRRQEGRDFDEVELIFNPAYAGMAFDVNYETYVERFYVAPFVFKGDLYFNETGSGALYKRLTDTSWERVDSWPETPAAVALAGDDVYALSENSILMRYGKRWPGYILGPVGGDDKVDIFSVIAEAGLTADCYVGEEGGTVVVSPRVKKAPVKVPTIPMFINSEVRRPTAYKAVKVIYGGGVAFVGPYETPEDNVCVVNVPFVSAYGHALQLAQRYHDFYQGGVIYNMRLKHDGVLDLKIGQPLQVDTVKGRLLSWEIAGDEVAITQEVSERQLGSESVPLGKGV